MRLKREPDLQLQRLAQCVVCSIARPDSAAPQIPQPRKTRSRGRETPACYDPERSITSSRFTMTKPEDHGRHRVFETPHDAHGMTAFVSEVAQRSAEEERSCQTVFQAFSRSYEEHRYVAHFPMASVTLAR